ncbi:hypothetical protein LTS15_000346 [Exophiala xenobiotica]|nr:hypothetical protein LTS15_000346 [Exophiala xenobiotica]
MDMNVWPNTIRGMSWPKDGMTYSYEHRGYIRPEKLEHWLTTAFGVNKAKYVIFNSRIYIKAPRQPTDEEREWMEDRDANSGVQVAEVGWMVLPKKTAASRMKA